MRFAWHGALLPNAVTDEDMEALKAHFSDREIVEIRGRIVALRLFESLERHAEYRTGSTPARLPPLCQSRSVLTAHLATIRQLCCPSLLASCPRPPAPFQSAPEDFTAGAGASLLPSLIAGHAPLANINSTVVPSGPATSGPYPRLARPIRMSPA
ncbi:MAG: hypothetical protein CM15mP103_13190 [Gammaproteobacteria bacterium]|nr:MAG: hypothetical protein CM15mP103_13190 [Gammaproteobacteria bacterium]